MPNNIEEDRVQAHLTSPYNFVPLNHKVLIPEWGDKISQDIPFEDGEDGTITVTFKNVTPLFIKNGMRDKKKDPNTGKIPVDIKLGTPAYEDTLSAHIGNQDGKRQFFIPATSLKGMIRSVMEVMTFSKMEQFDDAYFGYRSFQDQSYKEKMDEYNSDGELVKKRVKCGWLVKKSDSYELRNIDYPITYPYSISNSTGKIVGEKYLVRTGKAPNCKKKDYLFPKDDTNAPGMSVSSEVIKKFLFTYKQSPLYETIIQDKIMKNVPVPVFFIGEGNDINIGLSYYFRIPYAHKVSDGIPKGNSDSKGLDMTKCIMGFVNESGEKNKEANSLRGRVQFGNAFCENKGIKEIDFVQKTGVLGQPKASFYPFYLKQSYNAKYVTYENGDLEISGRKFYRIHTDNFKDEGEYLSGQSIPKPNVKSTLNLLPKGNVFTAKISLHNMLPIEIGALLSALTFHNTKGCYHNIGMGKSFGYGKLSLDLKNVFLQGFKKSKEEYLDDFENKMNDFILHDEDDVLSHKGMKWINTTSMQRLFSIFSDHNEDDTRMMDLSEYTETKKGKVSILKENSEFQFRKKNEYDYEKVCDLTKNNRNNEALIIINKLQEELKKLQLEDPELNSLHEQIINGLAQMARDSIEKARKMVSQNNLSEAKDLLKSVDETKYKSLASEISDLKTLIDETEIKNSLDKVRSLIAQSEFDDARIELLKIKEEQQNEEIIDLQKQIEYGLKKKAEQKKEAKVAAGLDFLGKIGYKISNFDKAKKQINDYLKKQGIQNIPNSEISKLKDFMNNMFVNKQQNNNHDKKRLEETSSDIWKTISGWIGDAAAKQLFGELKNQ